MLHFNCGIAVHWAQDLAMAALNRLCNGGRFREMKVDLPVPAHYVTPSTICTQASLPAVAAVRSKPYGGSSAGMHRPALATTVRTRMAAARPHCNA